VSVFCYFGPEASPYGTSVADGNLECLIEHFLLVYRFLNPPLQETSKVPFDGGIDKEVVTTDLLVHHNPIIHHQYTGNRN
jgi:hypothetical protein